MNRRHFVSLAGPAFVSLHLGTIIRTNTSRRNVQSQHKHRIDSLATDGPYFDAKKALEAGLTGAIIDMSMYPRTFDNAVHTLAEWNTRFRDPNSNIHKVTRFDHFAEAAQQKKFAVVLACQDGAILDSSTASVYDYNIQNLGLFYDLGLRVLQLTHNERNAVGDSFREREDSGLSRLGETVVKAMNDLGMLIDLSHCSRRTTLQAVQLSTKPCAITHAGCKALLPTARNKTDEEIRAVAEKGGYFGVFNASSWLTSRPTASISDIVDHIDHAIKLGGIDHVGFGSDRPVLQDDQPMEKMLEGARYYYERNKGLPGAETQPQHVLIQELNSPFRLQRLADELKKRRYNEDAIDKITGGNIARVLHDVIG